jgi:hypothetical protein
MDPAWLLLRHVLFLGFACRADKSWGAGDEEIGTEF